MRTLGFTTSSVSCPLAFEPTHSLSTQGSPSQDLQEAWLPHLDGVYVLLGEFLAFFHLLCMGLYLLQQGLGRTMGGQAQAPPWASRPCPLDSGWMASSPLRLHTKGQSAPCLRLSTHPSASQVHPVPAPGTFSCFSCSRAALQSASGMAWIRSCRCLASCSQAPSGSALSR